ncbi:MAG: hypothetical protein AAB152_08895 [Candidatus Coatesbacteria bacterium]|mgnify:FL=1
MKHIHRIHTLLAGGAGTARRLAGLVFAVAILWAQHGAADCVLDVAPLDDAAFSGDTLFPNWVAAPAAAFTVFECDDTACAGCSNNPVTGVTILNYGTATASDLTGVSFRLLCNATDSGILAMTYAGVWTVGGSPYPAWTWAGSIAWAGDPCQAPGAGSKGCGCFVSLYVYADIAPCPADGAVVELGPGYDPLRDINLPGGISDSCGCVAPWSRVVAAVPKTIRYMVKTADRTAAAPGDPVEYTIYYGRPGTGTLNWIRVTDSLPAYMHVSSYGTPAPDPGWDPDPGPPIRLRWTSGSLATTGGATQSVSFTATVDWGNGEAFEPGSGDVGAPEGAMLANAAHLAWDPAGCAPGRSSNQPRTVIQRFLFWKIGSNDILFAGRLGLPDDEIVYEIFIKNMSPTETWWDVNVWDTVPAGLDPWGPGMGFEDPCAGWTMTPTGCAAASPGRAGAASTMLTWNLDMPPGMTLTVRWKARIRPTMTAGSTVINRISLLELGRAGIVNGTGHSGKPAVFTHVAPVLLRTTYFSYVGYAAECDDGSGPGFFISFFPLNMAADFELRKLEYVGSAGVALAGGKSASINALVGSCVGGFADGGFSRAGCKVERVPARYQPGIYDPHAGGTKPAYDWTFLYKVTSNCPLLWIMESEIVNERQDAFTFLPSTSLNYRGFMHYTTMRPDEGALATAGHGDRLLILNTAMNDANVVDPALATVVHLFRWNPGTLGWDYVQTGTVDPESFWIPLDGTTATAASDLFDWRIVSSVAQLHVYQGDMTFGMPSGIFGSYNDHGGYVPNRENGNLVSSTTPASFYGIARATTGYDIPVNIIVGNTGAANATYRLWKYVPVSAVSAGADWPASLAGFSGDWELVTTDNVTAGLAVPGNPHVYGQNYDTATLLGTTTAVGWKVELVSGGPIQVRIGSGLDSAWAGGSIIHAANGNQSGGEFWHGQAWSDWGCSTALGFFHVFVPKTGVGVRAVSNDGYSAAYTTDGVDQCILFGKLSDLAPGARRNYRITQSGGPATELIAQYQQWKYTEKFFTAPFVKTGVHYDIIAPGVVFTGQSFWITVVVIDSGGGTKADYCGTTTFTSTDPASKIENSAMDGYNYTWDSSWGCGSAPYDDGVRIFLNMSMSDLGSQALIAVDTADGSITGIASILVVGADIKLEKRPPFSIAATGDTVQFRICWSNYSSASGFTFVVNDAVPMGLTFLPEGSAAALDCGNTDGVPVTVAYATTASPAVPAAASFTAGNPVAGTRWLRWTVPVAGVQTTGCACFRVTVQ